MIMKKLIIEYGSKKYKNTDTYLLAPEKTEYRETLKNQMSKGFSHYYNKLNTGRNSHSNASAKPISPGLPYPLASTPASSPATVVRMQSSNITWMKM